MKSLGTVTVTKNLAVYLKDIEFIIRDSNELLRGREIRNFPVRPREAVSLFLLCAILNETCDELWYITTDPQTGDGCLAFKQNGNIYAGFLTEQTVITSFQNGNINDCIITAIENKETKGKDYGRNRNLVIFLDKVGEIDHEMLQKHLEHCSNFMSYWLIGLIETDSGGYSYFVATLKSTEDPLVAYKVYIYPDFGNWEVSVLRRLD